MVFGIDFLMQIVQNFGYLGFVLIGFLSSFLIFIPSPAFIVVFLAAPFYNPLLLGLAAGLGSAIGEMTGYGAGYGLEKLFEKKSKNKSKLRKQIMQIEKLFQKYHPDLVIFAFAALPLVPIDALGIFCGVIKYNKKKFFFYVLLGKIIKFVLLAYMGFYGMSFILNVFGLSL